MDIHKTFNSTGISNVLTTNLEKKEAKLFIDEYILSFVSRTYGSNDAEKIITTNTMSEDEWYYKKDKVPLGHYFVKNLSESGYNVYSVYETEEANENYLSLFKTYRQKHVKNIFSIFALESTSCDITKSVLQIKSKLEENAKYDKYTDRWSRISAQAADIGASRLIDF